MCANVKGAVLTDHYEIVVALMSNFSLRAKQTHRMG